jgi:TonB family protein
MQATVDKQGVVRNVKVISGNAIFVPAAQEAVKHWLYQPALLNGKPIDYDVRIEVRFEAGSR